MYVTLTSKEFYKSGWFDPEGALNTLSGTILCFFGIFTGRILQIYEKDNNREKILRWLIYGIFFGLISGLLCNFSQNDGVIPLNENIWSISLAIAPLFYGDSNMILAPKRITLCNEENR